MYFSDSIDASNTAPAGVGVSVSATVGDASGSPAALGTGVPSVASTYAITLAPGLTKLPTAGAPVPKMIVRSSTAIPLPIDVSSWSLQRCVPSASASARTIPSSTLENTTSFAMDTGEMAGLAVMLIQPKSPLAASADMTTPLAGASIVRQ